MRVLALVTGALLFVAGCVPSDSGFGEVRTTVADRIDARVHWDGAPEGTEAARRVEELLGQPLGPDEAVQVALLHNPDLQAALDVLDIRAAQLLQASLLSNPHAEGEVLFHGEEDPVVELSLSQSISDLIFLPLARGVAAAELEAATFDAAGQILDTAYQTRVGFIRYLAAKQMLEQNRAILEAAFLSWDAARRLEEAGNLNDLQLAQERAVYEEARLAVADSELQLMDLREDLQVLMGLTGEQTTWEAVADLPLPPEEEIDLDEAERRAIERSIELAQLRTEYRALARRHDVARARGIVPEVRAGVTAEREGGEWGVGPMVELEVPLFQQGQGQTAVAGAEMRRITHRYRARAVRIRSAARAARFRLEMARRRAVFYRDNLLPVRERITELTLQHYNGMFASLFQLIEAKREEIAAIRRYLDSLQEYWVARATFEHILAGRTARLEEPLQVMGATESDGAVQGGGGGH